jgi:transposase-like protein
MLQLQSSIVAIDSETKLVLSHIIGKRNGNNAYLLLKDLSERVNGRFQLTTDGFKKYVDAVESAFGADIDF